MMKKLKNSKSRKDALSWILSHKDDTKAVLSWTGFNLLIRNVIPIFYSNTEGQKSFLSCLPFW